MDNESIVENKTLAEPSLSEPSERPPRYKAVIAWCTLGLGFVFTHLAFNYVGGIWGGVFWLIFGILGAVYAAKSCVKITRMNVVMFAIAELFCLTPLFSASRLVNFLAATFSFVLFFYLGITVSGAEPFGKRFVADLMFSLFVRPFVRFADCVKCALSVFSGRKRAKNVLYAVIGLLIAVPLTIVVAMLLVSSDARFKEYVAAVLSHFPKFSGAVFFEIVFAIPIAMYLFGALSSSERPFKAAETDPDILRVIPTMVTYFAVTPICLFYIAYIITQVVNIVNTFGNAENYAEFARNGFFELCAITVINLGVITAVQTFSKRTGVLKGYIVALGALSLGVTATAIIKMGMYISRYGMTLLRTYTMWFMLLMCMAFIMFVVLQFKSYNFWRALFFGFTAMFAVMCFGNFEGNIAAYNIAAYQSGALETLDVVQFEELGAAAVAPAYRLYAANGEDNALHDQLERFIRNEYIMDSGVSRSAYFSIPRAKAWSAFDDFRETADVALDPEELMSVIVYVKADDVYGIELEYALGDRVVGSMGMQHADNTRLDLGEKLICPIFAEDFPNPELLSSELFSIRLNIVGSDGVVTQSWIAERGGEYMFDLCGDAANGYFLEDA